MKYSRDLVAGVFAVLLAIVPSTCLAATIVGNLEAIDANGIVSGWVFDPDQPNQSVGVALFVDDPAGTGKNIANGIADIFRPDVNRANSIEGNHGFAVAVPAQYLDGKSHVLYVYGVGTTSRVNGLLQNSPKAFALVAHNPTGNFDAVTDGGIATGWALDPDVPAQPIHVHFYIDQPAADGRGNLVGVVLAKYPRPNEFALASYSGDHRFSFAIPSRYYDGKSHRIYAYAINKDGTPGGNVPLPNSPRTFSLATRALPTLGDAAISANGITIKTSARFAGAVSSLQWRGREFVDSHDHGREIQTAWTGNGFGECFNPTEAGSSADDTGPYTTSQLLSIMTSSNSLTTTTHPAFWQAPGAYGSDCDFDAKYSRLWHGATAINTAPATEATLKKTVTLGSLGISNIIEYTSDITFSARELEEVPLSYIILEHPAVYLTTDFSRAYRFDPRSSTFTDLGAPAANSSSYSTAPSILATGDGNYALGIYSDDVPSAGFPQNEQSEYTGYGIYNWGPVMEINTRFPATSQNGNLLTAEVYHFRTYLIIGTLADVQASMQVLYTKLHASERSMGSG